MEISIVGKSIIGTREDQQDSYYLCTKKHSAFAVVCDGMGGSIGGDAASQTVAEKFKQLYEAKNADEPIPSFFLRAIDILDESIVHLQKESQETSGAGTTIVAVMIQNGGLYWLSVGDSRLYILRGSEIVQVTRDHNFALSLENLTETESHEAMHNHDRHRPDALISFIGMGGVKIFDINETPFHLQLDDRVLLTTDGLTKALTDREILLYAQGKPLEAAMESLLREATGKAAASQDNTTCVLIHISKQGGTSSGGK